MNTGAEPGKLILSWEFWEFWERLLPVRFTGNSVLGILGILGIFRKHIATGIVATWKERNCLILLYITVGGLSLASEAAAGMNLPNARDGKARSVVR